MPESTIPLNIKVSYVERAISTTYCRQRLQSRRTQRLFQKFREQQLVPKGDKILALYNISRAVQGLLVYVGTNLEGRRCHLSR